MTDVLASNQIPADAYREFKQLCNRVDGKCAEWIALLSADVDADQVWAWYTEMYLAWKRLNEIAAVPGIAEYAAAQEYAVDPAYDPAAAFATLMGALVSAKDWLYAAMPRDVNGYLLTHTSTPEAVLVPRVYTPAETAALIPYLEAIAAVIV